MGTSTDTLTRKAAALLLLLVVACAEQPAALKEVYSAGYRALELGNLEAAGLAVERGLLRARDERDAEWVRAFVVLEAETLVAQRRVDEALERLDASLTAIRQQRDVVHARALMTRGYARCYTPDRENGYSSVAADFDEASRIAAALDADEVAIAIVLRRGTCALLGDDFGPAEADFRRAMVRARRKHLPLIAFHAAGSLGNLRVRQGRYDDATRWLRRSLDLADALPVDVLRLKPLGNLGWCYLLLGDFARAAATLSEAESLARERGYAGDRVIALTNLGHARRGQGNDLGAQKSYRRATAVAREIRNRADAEALLAYIHLTRAELALERGQLSRAASQIEEAERIRLGQDVSSNHRHQTLLLKGEVWARRGNASRAVALYRQVLDSPDAAPDVRWEARAALARVQVQADRPAAAEAEFQRAFELMETSLSQLVEAELRLPFFSSLRRFYDDYVALLVAQERITEALRVADDSRARLLQERLLGASTAPATSIDYSRLARDLDALLLFYWTAPERSFLWAITADGIKLIPLPGEEALEELVSTYQERIGESRDPVGEADPEGAELYRALVQLASAAMAAVDRVFIVPDGPLHQLNFESLIVSDPEPHYWIEDAIVVRAPSLRLLRAGTESQPRQEPSLLVLGDPAPPDELFPRLPFAGREVTSVADGFAAENRQIYAGPQAVPSAYRMADPAQFSYIHFAAHAQANSVVPLESAVVLSADNDGEYKLYARELLSIPLDAELVTLSACRSAGGRSFAGEGLVGLSWAFLSAGARNVIGGLWQVEDASTAALMEHLYRELVSGAEPPVALRRAKLELLRSGTAYRKPYYWAPFVTYTSRSGSQSPRQ